jgi:hypothetical protein
MTEGAPHHILVLPGDGIAIPFGRPRHRHATEEVVGGVE